jgi:NADH-quinone oxidoreductase subunit B
VKNDTESFERPGFDYFERFPGADVGLTSAEKILNWGARDSLWLFPMATSCCGIEFMATAASRFDVDRIGTITRGTPRQCDVMVIAGTITVKMAPRVKRLWDQMPEPKWAIAMGSCAISGDFYREIYSVVPGVDTFMPIDVYVPGCPPNPDHLLMGIRRLQEKIRLKREGKWVEPEKRPEPVGLRAPSIPRVGDPARSPVIDQAQLDACMNLGLGGMERRSDAPPPIPPPANLRSSEDSSDQRGSDETVSDPAGGGKA